MSIKAGLVGLPNVGKSTLFNALTKAGVPAENYPFCTIDPHMAITEVPDERMDTLQKFYNSQKQIPATVSFVDIAGLVKGAASGEGLGNKFLSNIREVDLILHVVRCFEDPNVIYSGESKIDPMNDFEIISAELMLKDLESVEKRLEKIKHSFKAVQNKPKEKKELEAEEAFLLSVQSALNEGNVKKIRELFADTKIQTIPLLSAKNFLIIANIAESEIDGDGYKNNENYKKLVHEFGESRVIPISAKLEGELSQLPEAEAQEMMEMMGLKQSGLDKIIQKTYENLGLITFFTCGPKEIHAWPITKGLTVRQASGEIHSDLERGFICADVFNYADLKSLGSESAIKTSGKMRTEGQEYLMADGDIINVKFNV